MYFETLQSDTIIWPPFPYKGLSYYEPEDSLIFAGRDRDLRRFAYVISYFTKRIVILHGRTGCGKTSFLRANVIPFLEKPEHGFQFMKTRETPQKALFVRSTNAPLAVLSDTIFDFLSKGFKLKTPIGDEFLNLSKALLGYTKEKDFKENTSKNPELMLEVLSILSGILPRTLVIVIDQAEEVLTIKPGKDGDAVRSHFFQFLSLFSKIEIDIKVLIAIRTEYYGEFYNAVHQYGLNMSSADDYLLKELDEDNLIRAIIRPTYPKDYKGYGRPRDQYKFSYGEKLAEMIAKDLIKATPAGGVLPVMQIVCSRLYSVTKQRSQDEKEWIISKNDYRKLGRVEGQVEAHLDEVLTRLCRKNAIDPSEIELEVSRWKNILLMLKKTQADGTVTTDLKTEDDLAEAALNENCVLDFKKAMRFLSDDQQRIIRESEVVNLETGLNVTCYSLGHDAIGLALKNYIPRRNLIKPGKKVFTKLQPDTSIWPQFPYKGLSYYEPQDTPIFAGRDKDLEDFAYVLSHYSKRIVILHGKTGCGKSSFLRANVIPFLERHEHGFQFLKTDDAIRQKALFVRSTGTPLVMLSDAVYDFLSKDFSIKTPSGERTLDLSKASLGYTRAKDFRDNTGENPGQMLEALNIISDHLPRTLVIIIDQAEEVLTIKPGKDGDAARSHFFQFLSLFSRIQIDIKILISIRSDHFGEFHNAIGQVNISSADNYMLQEFEEDDLIRAIKHPASIEDYEGHGCPRAQYKFSYETNLPEIIAQDIIKATPMGGLLPAMQIVCLRLYNATRERSEYDKEWTITKNDYQELGKVEGQIAAHLDEVLKNYCRKNRINPSETELEVYRWKNLLLNLVKTQPEGHMTTTLETEENLYEKALKEKCVLDFKNMMKFLSDDRQRILRKNEVVNETGLNATCYSLGHDAIGLALKNYTPQRNPVKPKEKVFICYAREDKDTAIKLYKDFKSRGITAWLDTEDLLPGQIWESEVTKAIKECSYFLALLSSNSVSKRGFVQTELMTAINLLEKYSESETFIIPVRLDNCMPETVKLQKLHWINLFPCYEEGLKRILRVIVPERKDITQETIANTDFDESAYLPRKLLHIKDDIPENLLLRNELSQDIINLVSEQNRIALTGDAGTGKTTVLKMIAWHFSKQDALFYPLLIPLNKYSEKLPLIKLLPPGWTRIPEKGLLIILDGLDEVEARHKKNVINDIEWLADNYPLSHIIVSCRTNFYRPGSLKGFSSYVLCGLDYNDIKEYIEKKLHKWAGDFYEAADQNQLGELLKIPFYLICLLEIFQKEELPSGKAEIFERLLSERSQYDTDHFKTRSELDEKREHITETLEYLALCMETLCRNYITSDEFQQIIPDKNSREIIKYCTLWNAAKLQFEHNNFQEYLAARILARQPLEIIKEFVSFEPDYKKIIPSWVNTVSFILSISDDQELFRWILDNEPEIAVKFEPNKIESSDKIRIFKNIFNNYKKKQIRLDCDKFNIRELGRFGQSDEIIDFLLTEAENPAHYTTLGNSIDLLRVMQLPDRLKQRAIKFLVISAIENAHRNIQYDALTALVSLRLNSKEVVEKIVSGLRYSENDWVRYGLYRFLNNCDYLDQHIDLFLEGIQYIEIGRNRVINEVTELRMGLERAKSSEAIKKIISYFMEHARELRNVFSGFADFSAIAENASEAYIKDNSVFDHALNFSLMKGFSEKETMSFFQFFDKTETKFQAFRQILSQKDHRKWYLLAALSDEKSLDYFVEQYVEGNVTDKDVWSFLNNLERKGDGQYLRFNKLINKKTGKFIPSPRRDYEKEKKERKQHDINLLFDRQAFLGEIKLIFDTEKKQSLTNDELIDFHWPESYYSDLAVEILRYIVCDQSISYEQAVKTINGWDWDWFCIERIYQYIESDNEIILSQKQEKWIANWCYSKTDKIDFKTAIVKEKDGCLTTRWDAIYLSFFLRKLNLEYPNNVLLDMLSFDYYDYYMGNMGIGYLEERLSKSDISSRILQNLEQGITVDEVLKNHIDYCKRHRIRQGMEFVITEIANTERDDEVRRLALETLCELSDTLSEIEEILPEITDDFKWDVIDELVKNKSEYVHKFLLEMFSGRENEEKFRTAEYLIRFQDLNALKYYTDHIKKGKKFSRSQYNTSPLRYLQVIEAVPLLIELLEITYHEDFNQEGDFDTLRSLVLDTLDTIALQSEHHYTEVKEAVNNFTGHYLSVYDNINWLYSHLDRLEQKYYTNKSEQSTIEDATRKLLKLYKKDI